MYYDYYGKHSAAYDQSTLLDAPTGRAQKDFELWYDSNEDIAMQIDEIVNKNMLKICGKELTQRRGGWFDKDKKTPEE